MKKILLIMIVVFAAMSCTVENSLDLQTINLKVNQSEWEELTDADGLNRYYFATFTMPEITNQVLEYGNVNAYIVLDNSQQILPYVRHFQDSEGFLWTRTVDYEYLNGRFNIFVTNSDFIEEIPETMSFRVVLLW